MTEQTGAKVRKVTSTSARYAKAVQDRGPAKLATPEGLCVLRALAATGSASERIAICDLKLHARHDDIMEAEQVGRKRTLPRGFNTTQSSLRGRVATVIHHVKARASADEIAVRPSSVVELFGMSPLRVPGLRPARDAIRVRCEGCTLSGHRDLMILVHVAIFGERCAHNMPCTGACLVDPLRSAPTSTRIWARAALLALLTHPCVWLTRLQRAICVMQFPDAVLSCYNFATASTAESLRQIAAHSPMYQMLQGIVTELEQPDSGCGTAGKHPNGVAA